jgi:phosphoribosylaminoimidazole (AIR) synthetase
MGIGMTAIVSTDKADKALEFIRAQKHEAWIIGKVCPGRGIVKLV